MSAQRFSDEDLTAFLDGEADDTLNEAITAALETDAALNTRLAGLDIPIAEIRAGYDALLAEAPVAPPEEAAPAPRPWGLVSATFGGGLAAGLLVAFLSFPTPEAPAAPGWKAVVASYQALYGLETLASLDPDAAQQDAELARVSSLFGLDLNDLPAAQGLTYKRAQILDWNGKPLVQIAFQRADGTPVALCILAAKDNTPKPMAATTLQDMAAVSWNAGGYGYLLIGGDDSETLNRDARPFESWSQAAT